MASPTANPVRFPVDPRGIPTAKAARRLGVSEAAFVLMRDRLHARGFPRPDPDTGCYDIRAIDAWMDRQSGLTASPGPGQGRAFAQERSVHERSLVQERVEAYRAGRTT